MRTITIKTNIYIYVYRLSIAILTSSDVDSSLLDSSLLESLTGNFATATPFLVTSLPYKMVNLN